MGKKKTTTTNTGLDPQSQQYVNQMRMQAQQAAQTAQGGPAGGGSWFMGPQSMSINDQITPFFNPYQQHVLGAVGRQYDHLRDQSLMNTSADATKAGAYGGSGAAVLAGTRMGELDRAQGQTMADLTYSGYNNALQQGTQYAEMQRQLAEQQRMEPLWRQQQGQQFMNLGMGPVGQKTTATESGNWASTAGGLLSGAAGLGMAYMGMKGGGMFGGGGAPSGGFQSAPPQQWQPPNWNPQYRGMFG